jgi:hypothetical protein
MATNLKHVGRIKSTGRRCMVVFRTLPNDAFNCLIIQSESLEPDYHDQLISLVESPAAQNANEFSEVLARSMFSDGSTMLPSLHVKGLLTKVATDQVELVPNMQTTILLSDLNQAIAEQQGVSVQDLAMRGSPKEAAEVQEIAKVQKVPPTTPELDEGRTTSSSVNQQDQTFETPESEAKYYRSQADKLAKQAADLRRRAEELVPTKKKTAVTS